MRANRLIIKYIDSDGIEQTRCVIEKWTWDDAIQGESYISFSIKSAVPIPFAVGDYCTYRGESYTLNYQPSTIQQGYSRSTGDAFVYENVKMDSTRDELSRVRMLDITPTTGDYVAALGTNHTGSAYFQLYCGETTYEGKTLTPVCALAAKMQANLDRAYPSAGWKVLVDTTTTKIVGGEAVLVTHTDDKVLSFNNTSIQSALAEVTNTFDLNYIVKGRTIYIGYTMKAITEGDDDTYFYLGYGKGYADENNQGKGLFKLERSSDSNQMIVTRLRAFGSTKNMPYRYYNKRYPNLSQSMFPTNLQLPDTFETPDIKTQHNTTRKETYPFINDVLGDTNDAYIDKDNDCANTTEGLREYSAKWDGTDNDLEEIYPTIEKATYGELRTNSVPDQDNAIGATAFPNYGNAERIDEILSVDDDANIGDGILAENASASQMEERFETEGWDSYFDTENTSYMGGPWWGSNQVLTTFRAQNPGSYILSFNEMFYSIFYTLNQYNPSTEDTASVKYRISFKFKSVATGIETDGPVYLSDALKVNNKNSKYVEWKIVHLPDAASSSQQVKEIKITEQSDITVYITPVFEDFRNDLNFGFHVHLGRSKNDANNIDERVVPSVILTRQNEASTFMNTPFTVILKDMGFDFKQAFGTADDPVVAMKDGMCVAREFKIANNPEKVEYTRDGQTLKGWKLTLSRAQDSSINTYYPSENYPLKAGEHFVLLNVEMPDAYVRAAEVRLLVAASIYLADNCNTRFTYTPYIDDIYLQRNYDRCEANGDVTKSLYWNLYAGLKFPFVGIPNSETSDLDYINGLTIEKITITEGGITPKVDIKLVEEVQQSVIQKLSQSVNKLENQSIFNNLYGSGSIDKTTIKNAIREYGDQWYLSKEHSDSTPYDISANNIEARKEANINILNVFGDALLKGKTIVNGLLSAIGGLFVKSFIKIGDFMSGLQGGYIDEQGNAELESLILRSYLAVPELRYNRITYFEGYNVISPGGGLTIDDYVINDDGTITVTPRLEDGEPCGQFVDDILLGYWHSKTASGDFAGFAKVQFRVVSVDYDAKTFVMLPNPDLELHIEKNMKLAQTGNFTNTERQTYIVIDTRYGNSCITFYDGVNTWTPTAAMAKAWFGKKKGMDIHGIDASTYSAVLQNIIMTGKIYQIDQISGQDIPVPIDKGAWVNGQRYAYYDRVTYNGSLWLCVNENGTTTEPSAAESSWLEQVAAGKGITSYAHWSTSICPVPANTILTFAQRLWISVRETSEPPLGCVTSQGAYVTYKDSEGNTGYVLRNPQTQSEDWVLLLDVSEMKDGDSIQVQYSADTTSWHTTFTEGDLYMRQRVGEASWSAAMRIVGESGQEGRHTEYQFTKNKSEYTQPTTGWQDAPPSLAEGEYLWMRTGVVIPPATAPATWAVVRLSGEKGDAGVGVSDVKEYYLASASSSGVTTATSGWTETPQSVSESKPYLWNYETISYTDSKTVTIDPHIIGRWGANGKNGVGIASVVNQYAKSNSGTETPSVWYTTPPAIDSTSRFLWNKETITYTDGTTSNIPAHVIGVYGEKGDDGADGMGITNYGHWSSSLGKLPALSMVTMGGKSWLSKVATANPPMGTVMSGGQRVKTKDASGQSVYVLSGLVNTTEWELVTESGRVFTLVPTVGSVVQTKLGFLSPSAFLVNVNQTVGSVSMPYTKGWVVARAMDYNGAMVQVVSASQTSQISITAYGSYTQYVVRLYSSYANARNWQGDFMAEATIPVIADGVDGKDGRTGSEPRPRGQWVSGNTYVYNEKFRDIVVYNGHIYRVRSYGASVTAAPTGSDSDTNWEGADEMKFVATDLLLAQDVYTDKLTVTKVNAKSADGTTTCTIEGNTGKLKAKKAEFDGVTSNNMTSTNMTATNMTVDGLTATNADISGKITATSGKVAGFSISGDGLTNEGFNNDAYLIFRNDTNKCFAGIGGNILPATSGARAVARFENHDTGDQWDLGANYGALVSAQGARTNVALHIDGGSVCGFAYKNLVVNSSGSLTLDRYDNNIVAVNTAELTLSLPSMKLYDDGHVLRIKRLGSGALKIKVSSCSTFASDGSERTSSPCLIYDANATLIPGNTLSFDSICDSMELVWVRDINRTYNNVTYYGCWVQYKIPRDW